MPRVYCGPLTDLAVIAQVPSMVVSLPFHVRPLRSDRLPQTETDTLRHGVLRTLPHVKAINDKVIVRPTASEAGKTVIIRLEQF